MLPKDVDSVAGSEDPHHGLIWVCTVFNGLSVQKLRINFCIYMYLDSLSDVDQAASDDREQTVESHHLLHKYGVHALFV